MLWDETLQKNHFRHFHDLLHSLRHMRDLLYNTLGCAFGCNFIMFSAASATATQQHHFLVCSPLRTWFSGSPSCDNPPSYAPPTPSPRARKCSLAEDTSARPSSVEVPPSISFCHQTASFFQETVCPSCKLLREHALGSVFDNTAPSCHIAGCFLSAQGCAHVKSCTPGFAAHANLMVAEFAHRFHATCDTVETPSPLFNSQLLYLRYQANFGSPSNFTII